MPGDRRELKTAYAPADGDDLMIIVIGVGQEFCDFD